MPYNATTPHHRTGDGELLLAKTNQSPTECRSQLHIVPEISEKLIFISRSIREQSLNDVRNILF